MKLDQLSYFVTTARTQHVGKASKILNISPSAISHSVRQLEDELGHALFKKSGKQIYLTDFGKRFSNRAKELLDHANNIQVEFTSEEIELCGSYRVGVTHGLCEHLITPEFSKVISQNPKLNIEMYSLRSADVKKNIVNGELDFGVLFSPAPHPQIDVIKTVEFPMKVTVRNGHTLLNGATSDQISNYICASPKAFSGIAICENHPELQKLKIRENVRFTFDSYPAAASFLKNSDAWALFPEPLIAPLGLREIPLDSFNATENYSFVVPKGRSIPKKFLIDPR